MLLYRFPGKQIERKKGHFVPCQNDELKGFVISAFSEQKYWLFQEDNFSDSPSFIGEEPVSISQKSYLHKANQLLNAIGSLGLKKVVFSRVKTEIFDANLSEKLFYFLEENYPNALVYFFSDKELGTWIGASPEVLFEQHGNCGITTALAGTKKREDQSAWSVKEFLEQEYVSDYIQETLNKEQIFNIELHGPYDYVAGPVKHLKTDFLFECSSEKANKILLSLHPTPATCGLPKDFASEVISQIEEHDRELYTGFIGEFRGDYSKLFVNLRCAKITKGKIHYFLGGGFTKDSDPEAEWLETENKKKTISDLIDLL
ncbi:MAG: chorismate-binding protein [Bacteroidetes bacterium]|nr:chorismate-binding protein [Bacteroidota bacterium]MBM3455086.1 hypothetical protein [Bacteroidota bacterium]